MKRTTLMLFTVASLLLPTSVWAQKIGASIKEPSVRTKTAAVLPLMFQETDKGEEREVGTDNKAVETYRGALFAAFEKLGISTVDQAKVNATWQTVAGSLFNTEAFTLPEATQLVELGKKLGVDYVVASRCHWLIRSPWVGLGPKTKAHSTVDLWIVDVAHSEFLLKADKVKSDSTEKEPGWKTAVTLLIVPISVFSGGPKTPHMERSGQLSLTKALDTWLATQSAINKIGG